LAKVYNLCGGKYYQAARSNSSKLPPSVARSCSLLKGLVYCGSTSAPLVLSNAPENPNLNETEKHRSDFRSEVGWGFLARRLNEA